MSRYDRTGEMPTPQIEDAWADPRHPFNEIDQFDIPAKYADTKQPKGDGMTATTTTTTIAAAIAEEISFDLTEAAISELSEKYYDLTIAGVDDKKGYDLVHKAEMHVKSLGVALEKRRKEIKAPWLAGAKAIDDEAKRYKLLLLPLRQRLASEQHEYVHARERAERQAAQEKAAEYLRRLAAMKSVDWMAAGEEIAKMSDREFKTAFDIAKKGFDAKRAAAEREAAELKARQEDLARREAELAAREALLPPAPVDPNAKAAPAGSRLLVPEDHPLHEPPAAGISTRTHRDILEAYADGIENVPLDSPVGKFTREIARTIVMRCTNELRQFAETL